MPASLYFHQIDYACSGLLANISLSGCFFPVNEKLPIGEECHLAIKIGKGIETEEITLSGQIVRTDATGVGIRFIDDMTKHDHLLKIISGCCDGLR